MIWSNPAAFAAFAALAVPIIVHLAAARERGGYLFPSLMFVRKVDIKRVRRRRVRDPWLLLLRCLALAALIAAFAQPVADGDDEGNTALAQEAVVIALDRSYSMTDSMEQAIAAAKNYLDDLSLGRPVGLVVFDGDAMVAAPIGSGRAALVAQLNAVAASAQATDLADALTVADAELSRFGGPGRIVLFSDLQRSGLAPEALIPLRHSTRLAIQPIDERRAGVGESRGYVWLTAQFEAAGKNKERVMVTPRGAPGEAYIVRLMAAEEILTAQRVDGVKQAAVTVALARALDRDIPISVTASLDDGMSDTFYATIPARRAVTVGVIGMEGPPLIYLRAALDSSGIFDVRTIPVLTAEADLGALDVVVASPPALADGLWERLRVLGVGIFLISGEADAKARWPEPLKAHLEPGEFRQARPAGGDHVHIAGLQSGHPLAARLQPDADVVLSHEPVWRYRQVVLQQGTVVVARFNDGTPALVELPAATGKLLYLTTGLQRRFSELARGPSFAPMVTEIVHYLASVERRSRAYVVGDYVDMAALWLAAGHTVVPTLSVQAPSGRVRNLGGEQPVLRLNEPGFYTVRAAGRQPRLLLAANVARAELVPDAMATEDLLSRVTRWHDSGATRADTVAVVNQPAARRPWSMLLLTAALLLFFSEAAVANWLAMRRRSQEVGA